MAWCGTLSCAYGFLLSWQTLIAGLIALFGAYWTVSALRKQTNDQRREQQRIAAMQVASQIRQWLIDTTHAFEVGPGEVEEERLSHPDENPDDFVFPTPSHVPEFPFQHALERISFLPSENAKSIFDLIERRRSAERAAATDWDFGDNELTAEIFETRIASIYVDCAAIYVQLGLQAGWSDTAVTEQEIATMRAKAAKIDEIRKHPSGIDLADV